MAGIVGLSFALCASHTWAGECSATAVPEGAASRPPDAQASLRFIRERLRRDASHARVWSYSWGGIYSSLAAGQLIAAPFVSHASALDLYVGGGAALLGLAPLVFTPLKVMADQRRLDEPTTGMPDEDPCVLLARAEAFLMRDAANEAQGRSLLFHGGNVVVNVGIFFLMGAGFGHWTSATISLLTGIAIGEIMILTQPEGAVEALAAYRRGDLSRPMAARRITIVPLAARKTSGVVLRLSF